MSTKDPNTEGNLANKNKKSNKKVPKNRKVGLS